MWLGSLAIFFYMGIEIGIPGFFADYSEKIGLNFTSLERTDMLKYYWGGLMVGRLIGIFVLQKFIARQILTLCAFGGAAFVAASLAIGAAILMPVMGAIQTATGSVVVAISCLFIYYLYLIFFATKGSKIRN